METFGNSNDLVEISVILCYLDRALQFCKNQSQLCKCWYLLSQSFDVSFGNITKRQKRALFQVFGK